MDVVKIDGLLKNINFDGFYLEATFQFKLLMELAAVYDKDTLMPERSVQYYQLQGLTKKEIDIVVEHENRIAFELKMPMNGQVPEQMFKFIEDIQFLEELKASGVFARCFLIAVTNNSNFWQGNKTDGIYAAFRNGGVLTGKISKPTGNGKDTVYHQLDGEYHIEWKTLENGFRYFVVEV
ncbi:MAG: hypothetical protein LBD20_04570 [Spirochaetaceae bacterium]|jgi:hypothetical protein|nr:hypothetical protein [Spirochaetaceae bacterium]